MRPSLSSRPRLRRGGVAPGAATWDDAGMSPDPDPLVLRSLAALDAAPAAAFIRMAFSAQPVPTDPPSSPLRETPEGVAALLAEGGGFALSGAGGDAALILFAERGGGLYCGRLAIHPALRGRGLARRLIAAAEEEGRRRGLARLWVKVRLALPGNLALFAGLGFREVGREAHPGYAAPTTAILEKALDA